MSIRAMTGGGTEARRSVGTKPRIVELDGLRGVAVALVLAFHVCFVVGIDRGRYVPVIPLDAALATAGPPSVIETVAARGYLGVLVFFVLSGFLLAGPFIRWRVCGSDAVPIGSYLIRRFLRIEPPYVVAVLASFALIFIGAPMSGWNVVASLLHGHQLALGAANPANAPMWSLEVEVQWYIVVPVVALALSSRQRVRRYLVAGTLAVAAIWFQGSIDLSSTRTDALVLSWLQFFLAGWIAADIAHTSSIGRRIKAHAWDVVTVVGWPVLFLIAGTWSLLTTAGPLVLGLLLIAAMRGPVTGRLLRRGWLVTAGQMSYSVYLVHYPVFVGIRWALGPGLDAPYVVAFAFWTVLLVPAAITVAAVFHRWVEEPCLDGRLAAWLAGRVPRLAGAQPPPDITPATTNRDPSPIVSSPVVP